MGEKSRLDFGDDSPENSLMHSTAAATAVKADFSGWASRANLECADGRTILPGAFAHQDKVKVPLVWQHGHDDPENVLGHVILENRDEGVYSYGYFNKTEKAGVARELLEHDDINGLSIFANKLVEKAKKVSHGIIREVSLVLAGANPGALIDNIALQHADGEMVTLDDEAIIYSGEKSLKHGDQQEETEETEETEGNPELQKVYDGMSEEQKEVVHFMVGAAIEHSTKPGKEPDETIEHAGTKPDDTEETRTMSRNVFEQQNGGAGSGSGPKHVLTHDALRGIMDDAQQMGSAKAAFEAYALKHGIEDIDVLFPDAKAVTNTPDFDKRRTEWVSGVLNGTRHSPFSRIKNLWADITHEQARAKGYIKGTLKKEEFFGLAKRTTGPTTVYKKQKLDRDDIIDITDLDVVAWLKGEMRLMLDEEIARAVLIGDGREVDDEDKVKDPAGASDGLGIRSILNDDDLYAAVVTVNIEDANSDPSEIVDAIIKHMGLYKGSGRPTFYTTLGTITTLLLAKDTLGRRLYRTTEELASELQVDRIVAVEVMEEETDLVGIIVNLQDYTIGADRGGEVSLFDDFDIDYNQYKYLIETRVSGALTKIRSALVVKQAAGSDTLVVPVSPAFVEETGVITPATTSGITYKRADTNATVTTGAPITLAEGDSLTIYSVPNAGKYFETNQDDEWTFTRPSA